MSVEGVVSLPTDLPRHVTPVRRVRVGGTKRENLFFGGPSQRVLVVKRLTNQVVSDRPGRPSFGLYHFPTKLSP